MDAAPPPPLHEFTGGYGPPVRDPGQPWPTLETPGPLTKRLAGARGSLRRRRHGRRLAYLDSMFPWERSGFRYHEALSLLALRPDTLFFSLWNLTDPFPAQVHPLSRFPGIALREGITDTYGVFSLLLEGLCGLHPEGGEDPHPTAGLDISAVVEEAGIAMHGMIYPGGGFTPTPDGLEKARRLAARLQTTFSYAPEALENIPGVTPVPQALTEIRFYAQSSERWARPKPLVCLFAADAPPRKGIDAALGAIGELSPADFHLHVVGPHQHRRTEFPPELVTFHGWLTPARLRDLHRRVHVFLSPVSAEPPGPPGSYSGVTDGFPTQAAADAMSSGVLLVSANPASDHRVLTPGRHYVDRPPTPGAVRDALLELAADLDRAATIARAGSDQVRARMDIREGTALKLRVMGLAPR